MADKKHVEDIDSDEEDVVQKKDAEPEVQEDTTLANPDVVTKYQETAKIVQAALVEITAKCVPGAKIIDICKFGDDFVEQRTNAIYKNKNKAGKVVMRGVAFPVCISVNECICHCSPLESETEFADLKENDTVKIDMGAHIDGYIVLAAHTLIVGANYSTPEAARELYTGRRAAVINAAYTCAEVAAKMIKNGNSNDKVSAALKQVAEMYDVRGVQGTLMQQMKQFVIDAKKSVVLREQEGEQKPEQCTFETGEVYAIDVAMSSGEGKTRDMGTRTTVYKRAVDVKYALKNKSSRGVFNEINKRSPTLPFTLRSLGDEKESKLGVRELITHQMLNSYPVLYEKKEEHVAHFKFTILLLPNGTLQITGLPPVTYQALVAGGEASSEGVQLMNGNIGRILWQQHIKEHPHATMPESIREVLDEVKPENKKKAKKAAKAAAAATTA